MHWYHILQHWLAMHTGSLNTSGAPPDYNFWSGFGSDIGEIAIIGGLISIYRKHNCHVKGCWRIARHPVTGTDYIVCRKHHPLDDPTHQEVIDAHRAVTGGWQ